MMGVSENSGGFRVLGFKVKGFGFIGVGLFWGSYNEDPTL